MNDQNYIPVTDVYEFVLNKLKTANPYEQADLIEAILAVQYVDDLISEENSKQLIEDLANELALLISLKNAPVDIFHMSAIYYKGKEAGYDTTQLFNAMRDNSEWLIEEQFRLMEDDSADLVLN